MMGGVSWQHTGLLLLDERFVIMRRRKFLLYSSTCALSAWAHAQLGPLANASAGQSKPVDLRLGPAQGAVPGNFIGLSYETQQLSDPAFFCAENATLIALFRTLSRSGVLRLGGNTSANSWWKATPEAQAPVFTQARDGGVGEPSAKLQYAIMPAAIHQPTGTASTG